MIQKRYATRLFAATATAVLLALAVDPILGQAPPQAAFTLLSRDGRRPLPLTLVNNQEFVALEDLAAAFQLTLRDEAFGAVAVGYKGKTILLTPDQAVASVGGRLVSLPAPPVRNGRRVLVPIEFVNRALTLIYDARLELRKPSRLLIVGDYRMPRVTMRVDSGDQTRIVIDATPRTESAVSQQNNALLIKFDADALDLAIAPFQPQPLVQGARIVEPTTIAIDLGQRFGSFRATSQPLDNSTRLTIDLVPAQPESPAAPATPAPPPPPDLSGTGSGAAGLRVVAIDPGHGGDDEGVKGAAGTKEKDLTLAVSRRIKTVIEGRLGVRVVLTRDDDRSVSVATRTAIANNNRADVFISIHANASFQKAAGGASILYAAFGRDTERSARASSGAMRLPTLGGTLRDVDLVFWDLAQVRHVGRSRELAGLLEEQFRERIPVSAHAVDSAPLDVLESANMPAVMLEMGYLTNEQQEAQLTANDFQGTLVQAIFDALLRFRDGPAATAQ